MVSAGERRAFLVGMTLNELVFLLFFLLLIISAVMLKGADRRHREQAEQSAEVAQQLQQSLQQSRQQLDDAFRKLVLQEAVMSRLEQVSAGHSDEQLDDFFSRLVEDRHKASQLDQVQAERQRLSERNQALQAQLKQLADIQRLLDEAGLSGDDDHDSDEGDLGTTIQALITTAHLHQQRADTLAGQLALAKQQIRAYEGSGVDHAPCWTDPRSGEIEYLYRITILESGLRVEAAWPPHRNGQISEIPGAAKLPGRQLDNRQFLRLARPIYDWSLAHDCRHFVRVTDQPDTSKQTFKTRLQTIEAYFYKLLQR